MAEYWFWKAPKLFAFDLDRLPFQNNIEIVVRMAQWTGQAKSACEHKTTTLKGLIVPNLRPLRERERLSSRETSERKFQITSVTFRDRFCLSLLFISLSEWKRREWENEWQFFGGTSPREKFFLPFFRPRLLIFRDQSVALTDAVTKFSLAQKVDEIRMTTNLACLEGLS